jgi:hypothetical protein
LRAASSVIAGRTKGSQEDFVRLGAKSPRWIVLLAEKGFPKPGKERAVIRKFILTAAIALTTLTGLVAVPSTADAEPLAILPHHRFEVLAERGGNWGSHGVYRSRARAELLATRLRHEGYKVEIRQF